MKRRRGHTLRRRYGHAKGGSMRGLAHWSTFADGGYELVFEGRKYSIHPRHALEHGNRRSGGWSLSVSPGTRGLHSSIDRLGARSIGREIAASVTHEYKPGSPVDISHGARAFGDTGKHL